MHTFRGSGREKSSICSLGSHSDRRHVGRAAFESIAFQIREALETMLMEAGVPLVSLHGAGGPTASAFLMQLTADIEGAELRVASMPDCSTLDAVLAGQIGMGAPRTLPELQTFASKEDVSCRPTMDSDRIEKLKSGWQAALRATVNVWGDAPCLDQQLLAHLPVNAIDRLGSRSTPV